MNNILISVIVPAYNVEDYIDDCMRSLVSQSYKNIEIIVINDGSTDGTLEKLYEWSKSDSRIKVINKDNEGVMQARCDGVSQATGDYIAFIDGDDWVDECIFSDFIENYNGAEVFLFDIEYDFPDKSKNYSTRQHVAEGFYNKERLDRELLPDIILGFKVSCSNCNKIIKATLVKQFINRIPKDTCFGEDAALSYACLFNCNSMIYLAKSLYHYRRGVGTTTEKYSYRMHSTYMNAYDFVKELYGKTGVCSNESLEFYALYLLCSGMKNEMILNDRKLRNEFIKNAINNPDIMTATENYKSNEYFYLPYKIFIKALSTKKELLARMVFALFRNYVLEKGLIYKILKRF